MASAMNRARRTEIERKPLARRLRRYFAQNGAFWLMALPGLALILVFALVAVVALWLSFRVANTAMHAMVDQREVDKVQTVGRMVGSTLDGQSRLVTLTARLTASRNELGKALLGNRP